MAANVGRHLTTNEENNIRIAAMSLSQEETTREVKCPACGHDKDFSITRIERGILYNCFRDSCGISGFVPSSLIPKKKDEDKSSAPTAETKPRKIKPYEGKIWKVPSTILGYLVEKYELPNAMVNSSGMKYDKDYHRLLIPLRNFFGEICGWYAKKLPGSSYSGPKAMVYWEKDDGVGLYFPKSIVTTRGQQLRTFSKVGIVEDPLSAIKLSDKLVSCALLGTSLNKRQAGFLANHFDDMLVMLDPDASASATQIRNRYSAMFFNSRVILLDKDPKDTPHVQLRSRIFIG